MLRPDMILQRSINAAIAGASNFDDNTDLQLPNSTISQGAIQRGLVTVQSAFGSGFKFIGLKDGVEFLRLRFDTNLEIVNEELRLPATHAVELADTTTLTGTLVGKIENGSLKIEGTLGKSLADFILSKDVVSGEPIDTSAIAFRFNRGLDPGGGGDTGLALVPVIAGGYSVTSNDYKRLFGPGLQAIDALANLIVGDTATENRVYLRFKAPASGPITSIQTYWAVGGVGYAAGTGGTMALRVFPDDGTSGHRPNVAAASLSNGSLSGQLSVGAFTGGHTFFEPVTMTPVTDVIAGQIYHVEFRNTDGAPGTNYISVNCSVVVTPNGDGNDWLSPNDWGVIFAFRTIGSGSAFTMQDFTVNPNPTAANLKYRPILFVTIGGQKYGNVELESGNLNNNNGEGHPYIWTVASTSPIREQVTLTSGKKVSGFSIWTAASVPGNLYWEIGTGASVVRSGTINQATANFATELNYGVQQGIYKRYDVALEPPLDWTTALHNHTFAAQGAAVWKFADDYPGDYAYVGAWNQSKAQSFETGAWLDANHRNHTIAADQRSNLRIVYHEAPPGVIDPGSVETNSLDIVCNDMRLNNDFVLAGYESYSVGWYVNAQIQFGATMNTSNAPQWWKNAFPSQVPMQLRAILPWIVFHKASGEPIRNVRIYLKNFRCYYLRADTLTWQQIGSSVGASGFNTGKAGLFNGSSPEEKRINPDGSVEIRIPDNQTMTWHGWWDAGRPNIDYTNVAAIHATCQYKLVTDNPAGPNDLETARYGMHVGVDYYIDSGTNWQNIAPGAGVSRVKQATTALQSLSMTTFTNIGVQDPGNSGITEAYFRSNPPPLD